MTRPRNWTIESLFENTSPEPNTGCWLWTESVDTSGYANCKINRKTGTVHRLMAKLCGMRITGKEVMHSCDQPSCINPRHLAIGTHADNMVSMRARGRHPFLSKTHCPNGHPYSGANLRKQGNRRICRECARRRNRDCYWRKKERT